MPRARPAQAPRAPTIFELRVHVQSSDYHAGENIKIAIKNICMLYIF